MNPRDVALWGVLLLIIMAVYFARKSGMRASTARSPHHELLNLDDPASFTVATKDAATQTRRTGTAARQRVSWEFDENVPRQRLCPDMPLHVEAQVATHMSRSMDAAFGSQGEPEERSMTRQSRARASEAGPRRDDPTSLNLTSSQEKTLLQRRQRYMLQNASQQDVRVDARAGQKDADTERVLCWDTAFDRKRNTSSIDWQAGPPSTTRRAGERPKSPQASASRPRSRRSEEGRVETCRSRASDASPTRYSGPVSHLTPSQARTLRQQRTSDVWQAARTAP